MDKEQNNQNTDLSEKDRSLIGQNFEEGYTYEQALTAVGFGKYQYCLFFLTGAVWAADAMEVMLLTFLVPELENEWNLSSTESGSLGAVVFLGMLFGAWFWAYMSDMYGRRIVLLYSLFVCAFFGLLSAFSVNIIMLLCIRFWVGFAAGGSSASYTLFAEFAPTEGRGAALLWEQGFWSAGAIFAVVIAWIFIPCCGWSVFVAMSSVPLWFILLFWKWVPESPRWLLTVGRIEEAQEILDKVSDYNGKPLPPGKLISDIELNQERGNVKFLWLPAYRLTTNLLLVSFFSCVLTYYGISFIAERVFEGGDLYWEMLITTFSEIPGLIMGFFILDWIGRRYTMGIFFGVFTVCSFFLAIPFVMDVQEAAVFLVFVARMSISTSFYTLYIYYSEFYPTVIRNTALGTASALGRVAGIMTSYVITELSRSFALLILGVFGLIGTIGTLSLPIETLNREMDDRLAIELDDLDHPTSMVKEPLMRYHKSNSQL